MEVPEIVADSSFWSALWPALAATIVGVALGLPIALWINRIALGQSSRNEEAERKVALARVCVALRESVTWNADKANGMALELNAGSLGVDSPLETERWEAIKPEFVRVTQDPELQSRVAFFFDQVRRASVLADRLFDVRIRVSSTDAHAAQAEQVLASTLEELLTGVSFAAHDLERSLLAAEESTERS